jgi:hypothetical protein
MAPTHTSHRVCEIIIVKKNDFSPLYKVLMLFFMAIMDELNLIYPLKTVGEFQNQYP